MDKLQETLNELRTEVAGLKAITLEAHRRLFGDGQPGELTSLKKRLRVLEHWRTAVCTIVAALIFVVGTNWVKLVWVIAHEVGK